MNLFYTLINTVDGISFGYRELVVDSSGRVRARTTSIFNDQANDIEELGRAPLLTSQCLILMMGERDQRHQMNRLLARRTRNIRVAPDTIEKYFIKGTRTMFKDQSTESSFDAMKEIFENAVLRLGFPLTDPHEYSFTITHKAINRACDSKCRNYLKSLRAREVITDVDLMQIASVLRENYECCAEDVLMEISKTKSRGHLSILSLPANEGTRTIFVNIVNSRGSLLCIEAWKFLKLMEEDQSLLLHKFESHYRERNQEVRCKFNNQTEGEVVGHYDKKTACLQVACISEEGTSDADRIMDHTWFLLDNTYMLLMYLVLKRILDDAKLFEEYLQNASLDSDCIDIFDRLTPPPIHLTN